MGVYSWGLLSPSPSIYNIHAVCVYVYIYLYIYTGYMYEYTMYALRGDGGGEIWNVDTHPHTDIPTTHTPRMLKKMLFIM